MTLRRAQPAALDIFKDNYLVEFLDLAKAHNEADLHEACLPTLKIFCWNWAAISALSGLSFRCK